MLLADISERDKSVDSIFAIRLAGHKHYMALTPSIVKQVFAQRPTVLTNRPLVNWLAKNGFGDKGTTAKVPELYDEISSNLHVLMTEAAIMDASNRTAKAVGRTIFSLTTFKDDPLSQRCWEHGADINVLADEKEPEAEVEAEFFHLMTRWAYSCSTPAVFGQALLDQCPHMMDDVFEFDEQFPMLITGLPALTRKMSRARAAVTRSSDGIEAWYRAFRAVEDGRDPGPGWGNMEDVSELAKMQHRTWRKGGKDAEKAAFANLLGLFWGLHTNSNLVFFWFLTHIYGSDSLLASIRSEVAPFLTRLPNGEYSFDHTSLSRLCPLLKSTWLETMRQDVIGAEQKYILQDFMVTESPQDATLLRGKGSTPRSYVLKAGNVICVHNGATQNDPRLWKDPLHFNPERFLVEDEKKGVRAEWPRHLYSFGGGYSMCKGRLFAEREVLTFVAAVVTLWDIEYMGPKNADGTWAIKKGLEAGAPYPAQDVRVRIKRRQAGEPQ